MVKKNTSFRRRQTNNFDPTLSRGILAILLLVLAVIITLSFFNRAGTIGIILNNWILSFLFGSIRYATPVILAILAWFLVKDIGYNYRSTHIIGTIIFFLSLSSILHLQFLPADMWNEALIGHGGGIFGMLAWPLRTYMGLIASWVLLIGLTLVSIILIFNTSITHFILFNKKLMSKMSGFGRVLQVVIRVLFVRDSQSIRASDEYSEEEDEYDDDDNNNEEDDEEKKRKFIKKRVKQHATENEDEYDDEETEEEELQHIKKSKKKLQKNDKRYSVETPAWAQNVIIKDLPPLNLLRSKKDKPTSGDIKLNGAIIHDTLREFGIDVDMGKVRVGPTVTQYSLKPAKGIKLTRITSLSNDLALALAAHPIRIEAPIPGQSLVGIEVPNEKTAMVTFRELIESKEFRTRPHNMMMALGKDVAGKIWFADLPRMPHLLIAGATGSGKTVCVNTIIMSLLYQNTAETLRMIMVDPKRVELTLYNGIPHLLTPVITNTNKTVNALKWIIREMERRFEMLSQVDSRDITSYNNKHTHTKLPHIVFVIDELADLMTTAGNEMEAGIIRLAQMARAVGIHLIVATQRPSVDVITGLMKANIPGRIAFSVASLIDSRTIIDAPGAEKLIGRGDMLFQTAELSKPVRVQGAFISEDEMKNVVDYLRGDEEPTYDESIIEKQNNRGTSSMFGGSNDDQDPLFEEAKQTILDAGRASASFLQRKLKVGYARAARILDELEEAGIIGPSDGAKPREILVTESNGYDSMDAGGELNAYDNDENTEIKENENEEESDDEFEDDDQKNNEDE